MTTYVTSHHLPVFGKGGTRLGVYLTHIGLSRFRPPLQRVAIHADELRIRVQSWRRSMNLVTSELKTGRLSSVGHVVRCRRASLLRVLCLHSYFTQHNFLGLTTSEVCTAICETHDRLSICKVPEATSDRHCLSCNPCSYRVTSTSCTTKLTLDLVLCLRTSTNIQSLHTSPLSSATPRSRLYLIPSPHPNEQ